MKYLITFEDRINFLFNNKIMEIVEILHRDLKKIMKTVLNKYYAFFIAIMVLIADQAVKNIIAQNILLNEKITVLNNILSFTKIYNTGAAFGFFQDKTLFLATFSVFVIVAVSILLIRTSSSSGFINKTAWGLILGGTLGNFIDRIGSKYVLDFIRLDFINFPIFNIADICINCGAALLIICILFISNDNEPKALKG